MTYLALIRHGETKWNRVGRFTGWSDEPLTEKGEQDARSAGRTLACSSCASWDVVYTSKLQRAVRTAELALSEIGSCEPELVADWRLNERHVGALEGRLHADVAEVHGRPAVESWRWGWDVRPPEIAAQDPRQAAHRIRYPEAGSALPVGEGLQDVVTRVQPWLDEAQGRLRAGQNVVAVTHGTTLRALRVIIEGLGPAEAFELRAVHGGVVLYDRNPSGRLRPVQPEPSADSVGTL